LVQGPEIFSFRKEEVAKVISHFEKIKEEVVFYCRGDELQYVDYSSKSEDNISNNDNF
jgi:hypothetical protein